MTESSDSQNEQFSVERIAALSKLAPDNVAEIGDQLQRILDLVAVLDELQLEDVEPFFGASDLRSDPADQPIRSDVSKECLSREAALKNAPHKDDEFYAVPPVF